MQINWIQILKLKWIEPNTIFFSFGFNTVCVFSEIPIELNLVELNQIEYKLVEIKLNWVLFIILLSWIQPNYEILIMRRHMLILSFHIHVGELVRRVKYLSNYRLFS
jgi:hypothetical protein